MHRCLVVHHMLDWRRAPSSRTFDDASNHELRKEQAIGEAWHGGVHFLRCDAQRESKSRLRLDNVNVATARTLNNAMNCCIRRAQISHSAERFGTSCWIVLMIVLCTLRERLATVRMAVALRQPQLSWHCGSAVPPWSEKTKKCCKRQTPQNKSLDNLDDVNKHRQSQNG